VKRPKGIKLRGTGKGATTLTAVSPLEGLAEHAPPTGAPSPARRNRKLGLLVGAAVVTLARVVILDGVLIKTRGQWIECFLDGESVFKVSHPDRWGGKVGFFCVRMAVRFKDIEVNAPDGKVLWEGPPELPQ
jgi:hypothetical protein